MACERKSDGLKKLNSLSQKTDDFETQETASSEIKSVDDVRSKFFTGQSVGVLIPQSSYLSP